MKVYRIVFIVIFLFSLYTVECKAQNKDWLKLSESLFPEKKFGGGNVLIRSIQTDNEGNVIICGNCQIGTSFDKTVLDSRSSWGINDNVHNGNTIGFIIKYDAEGNLLWLKKTKHVEGFTENTWAEFVGGYTDKNNNIYLYGYLKAAFFTDYPLSSTPQNQMQIFKFDPNGNTKWISQLPPSYITGFDYSYPLIDSNQNISFFHSIKRGYEINYGGLQRRVTTDFLNIFTKYDSTGKLLKIVPLDSGNYCLPNWNYYSNNTRLNHKYYLLGKHKYGFSDNHAAYTSIRKYNLDGDLQSEKKFPPNYAGCDSFQAYNFTSNIEGDFFVYGMDTKGLKYNAYLVKLDSNFTEKWTYALPKESMYTWSMLYAETSGNVVVRIYYQDSIDLGNGMKIYAPVKYTSSHLTENSVWLKFDSTGKIYKVINESALGNTNSNYLYEYASGKCGEYYISAAFSDSFYLGKDVFIKGYEGQYKKIRSVVKKYSDDTTQFIRFSSSNNYCDTITLIPAFYPTFTKIYWLKGGEVLDSNKTSFRFGADKSGKYPITLLGIKDNGCQNTFTDTLTFFKQPEAKFSHKDTVGCQWVGYKFVNQSVADTINTTIGESYLWDFGDGTTDTAKNPLHIFTKSGKFKVSLIYSNGFCSDTFIQEQTVEILAAPKPGFTVNDTIGCVPFTVNVKDNSEGAVAKYTYSFGNEYESNEGNPTYTFTKPGIYYITQKLLGATGCITSDSVRIRIRAGILPEEKPEMFRATFITNNEVEISWKKHPLAKHYNLYKQYDKNAFVLIQKHFSDTLYMDQSVSPDKPFRYYIQATDSCDNLSAQSFIAQPVILQGENKDNTIFLLSYTPYDKWQNGVKEYVLQYQLTADSFTDVTNTASLLQTDSFRAQSPNSTQCYRILALEMNGNKQESYSNTVCLPHIPQVYVPNAFSPNKDAVNDVFSISAIGITESNINIYNRWGEKIYQNQQGESINWDGNFISSPAPDDVYIYTLQLRTIHGKKIYQTGNIHLNR